MKSNTPLLKVQIADDSEHVREKVVEMVRDLDFVEVVNATACAPSTIEGVKQNQPDVLLLDLQMPGGGGLAVLEGLNALLRRPMVVVLSNYSSDQYRKKAFDHGACHFLDKSRQFDRIPVLLRQRFDAGLDAEEPAEAAESKTAISGPWTDIAQSQLDAMALRESQERFRELAEHIQEVFWVTDPSKNQMLYISPAYETIWGRTCASLYASPRAWLEAIHPDDRERVLQAAVTRQTAGTYNEQYRIVRPDASVRWIEDRAFPVRNDAGEVHRVVGVASDITERKALETSFCRTQRLESLGTLASGIAHDLNNVLAPILMLTQVLQSAKLDDDAQTMLSTIETCATRGAEVVNQVLMFARGVEGERIALQPVHCFRELLRLLHATFPKNIQVTTSFAKHVWSVLGDATQVHQILLNLCVNASHAMPDGGRLSLSAENFLVDESYASMVPGAKAGPHVLLKIKDEGHGISKEVREKMFEPFFTTKPKGKGTGLGLSSALGIVRSHGGFMDVESELGQGATFFIYLPALTRVEPPVGPSGTLAPPRGEGETILIVDDEDIIREMLKRVLEMHGYTVLTAADGIEGVTAYARYRQAVKLVITDLLMPKMDGVMMTRVLKRINPWVRIIASSGGENSMEKCPKASEFRDLGVGDILTKPFSVGVLLQRVHEVPGRSPAPALQ